MGARMGSEEPLSSLDQGNNRIKAVLQENFYLTTYCLFLF